LSKKGLVKNENLYQDVQDQVCLLTQELGLEVKHFFESGLKGKTGNKEFFIYAVNKIKKQT